MQNDIMRVKPKYGMKKKKKGFMDDKYCNIIHPFDLLMSIRRLTVKERKSNRNDVSQILHYACLRVVFSATTDKKEHMITFHIPNSLEIIKHQIFTSSQSPRQANNILNQMMQTNPSL